MHSPLNGTVSSSNCLLPCFSLLILVNCKKGRAEKQCIRAECGRERWEWRLKRLDSVAWEWRLGTRLDCT